MFTGRAKARGCEQQTIADGDRRPPADRGLIGQTV
jgi:hypothetical protein